MPEITIEEIWPMVQLILAPMSGLLSIGAAIALAGLVLGVFLRLFSGK